MQKQKTGPGRLVLAISIAFSTQAIAQVQIPDTTVKDTPPDLPPTIQPLTGERTEYNPDVADWVKAMPGADVNGNGPISGIVQYRGMYGNRVKILLDDVEAVQGCTNSMDPVLHYTSAGLVSELELARGISPVSNATETFGGFVKAVPQSIPFTDQAQYRFKGGATFDAQSADTGLSGAMHAAMVNNAYRFGISASADKGDDYEFPGGSVLASEYQRHSYGLDVAHQGQHNWSLGVERAESKDTGTPALPMDILSSDADIYKAKYSTNIANGELYANIGAMDVEHVMTNYALRTPPADKARWRSSRGDAEGRNATIGFNGAAMGGTYKTGADLVLKKNTMRISNPNNAMFFLEGFNDARRDIASLFFEWDGGLGAATESNLGIRYNQVDMDADEVNGTPALAMPPAKSLRDEFNATEREKTDHNIDVAMNFGFPVSDITTITLGLGHKMHSPTFQQRYLWIPLQATGGLADGRNYIGDIDLKPEQAWQFETGADISTRVATLSPRLFYQRIDNYIQGVPSKDPRVIMISSANGDPHPLQYSNVEAEIYGLDMYWDVKLHDDWGLDGTISYTRGKRRDIEDNLYRLAPPNARTTLYYTPGKWTLRFENILYDRSRYVSETNGEPETGGYSLFNLSARYAFRDNTSINLGVSNLFDKYYQEHLNGVNRVMQSDVAVGDTLPGRGRSAFVNVRYAW
jgi:iron complex outermembrane receptor protein